MNDRGIPPQWHPYFDAKQIEGYRELGRKAQIDWTRARRVVIGGGTTDEAVKAVADALGIPSRQVWELRGQPVPTPFVLPDEAGHLNRRERDAILAIVNSLIESKGIEQGQSSDQSQAGAARLQQHQRDFRGKVHNPDDGSEKRA